MPFESDDVADTGMALNAMKSLPPFLANMAIVTAPQKTFEKADHFNIEASEIEGKANVIFAEYSQLKTKIDIFRSSAYDLQRLATQDRDQICSALDQILQHHEKILPRYKNNAKRAQLLDDLILRSEEGLVVSEEITELYQNLQAFCQWKLPGISEFENTPADAQLTVKGRKRRRLSISSSDLGANMVATPQRKARSTHVSEPGVHFKDDLADPDEITDDVFKVASQIISPTPALDALLEIEESLSEGHGKRNRNDWDNHSDSEALSIELGTPIQKKKKNKHTTNVYPKSPTFNKEDNQHEESMTQTSAFDKAKDTGKKRDVAKEQTLHQIKQEIVDDQFRGSIHEQKQKRKRNKSKKKKAGNETHGQQIDEVTYATDSRLDDNLKSSLKNMKKNAFKI